MRWVKWGFLSVLMLLVASVLHYNLPHHDIVRVVGTYQERKELGDWTRFFWSNPDDQANTLSSRDVQFIQAITPKGRARVYRNEDTGWGWPPYFKFDTSNLQTEAEDLRSTAEAPRWAIITHYGWRNEFLSIYPNAVSIKPATGPDVTVVPWTTIIILILLVALIVLIWRMLAQFRERMIDPLVDEVGDTFDELDARADQARARARGNWGRFKAWLRSWQSPPRR